MYPMGLVIGHEACRSNSPGCLKGTSHCRDKTGNTDANVKCWRVAGLVSLHRPSRPTADERQMSFGRRYSAPVGRSVGRSSPISKTFSHPDIFSSSTYHFTSSFPSSQNRLLGLFWHNPKGDFSSPVPPKAFLVRATGFGLSMFALQVNGYCACGNRVRSLHVRRRLQPFSIYDLNRRPAQIA